MVRLWLRPLHAARDKYDGYAAWLREMPQKVKDIFFFMAWHGEVVQPHQKQIATLGKVSFADNPIGLCRCCTATPAMYEKSIGNAISSIPFFCAVSGVRSPRYSRVSRGHVIWFPGRIQSVDETWRKLYPYEYNSQSVSTLR